MLFDINSIRQKLKTCDLQKIFIEELGWDYHTAALKVQVNGGIYLFNAIAQKRGMAVFLCHMQSGQSLPTYPFRRKIETQVTKSVHEHIIIYIDYDKTYQIWQWVKRKMGKPMACKEHPYHCSQPGDALIQKLTRLAFSLDEEEKLTIIDVTGRAKSAFDIDRVTRRFYDRFKDEHTAFLEFLKGIPDKQMQRWYVSVMLNRLMFIYFIQKKGFLNNDNNYLMNKLKQSKQKDRDRFYTNFLCPLFFDGFAKRENERAVITKTLLGKIPYLNGGIFLKHQIEELHGNKICIADTAFDKLFAFFEQYHWHLDERPLRADNEINPDVLGYIFEKYINQKQMGAYYTKEDITEYIAKNTVIPYLFSIAKQKCKIAFEGEQSIWKLLQKNPERYIYDAGKKGVALSLPNEIARGLKDVSKRGEWNKPAPSEYALPTEIWREVVARRQRYEEVCAKIKKGEITDINDFITYNLNIRQFAQDIIENCEEPELLRAFWHAIVGRIPEKSHEKFEQGITILDPTCGSGAFLFAALNILEPLYETCLDRMESFLGDLDRSNEKHRSDKYGDFRRLLEQIEEHPNRAYYIYKSIILNNLYGVDIMEEAVEICKLRLFLKLMAQIETVENIEPLPDIDFNIRAGNTLVGYATYDAIKNAISSKFDFDNTLIRIEEKAQDVDRQFQLFRQQQTVLGGDITAEDKNRVRKSLKTLENELNQYLAQEYGINPSKPSEYQTWLTTHKPFHWFIEFHGIIKDGGFDVIIGNPPYVEYSNVKNEYSIHNYHTEKCGNIYAYIMERIMYISHNNGICGMILQLSSIATRNMTPLHTFVRQYSDKLYVSCFAERPQQLFVGACIPLTIVLAIRKKYNSALSTVLSTGIYRWHESERETLFDRIFYCCHTNIIDPKHFYIPKIQHNIELSIYKKFFAHYPIAKFKLKRANGNKICYRTAGGRYWKVILNSPFGNESSANKCASFDPQLPAIAVVALLSSNLFWWYYILSFDIYNLKDYILFDFRFDNHKEGDSIIQKLVSIGKSLMSDYKKHSKKKKVFIKSKQKYAVYYQYLPRFSKQIIDNIDYVLGHYYDFTEEEIDFITNYDIKYRMGIGK